VYNFALNIVNNSFAILIDFRPNVCASESEAKADLSATNRFEIDQWQRISQELHFLKRIENRATTAHYRG